MAKSLSRWHGVIGGTTVGGDVGIVTAAVAATATATVGTATTVNPRR